MFFESCLEGKSLVGEGAPAAAGMTIKQRRVQVLGKRRMVWDVTGVGLSRASRHPMSP